jgi:ketosteroid isomerase-like protein
MKFLTSYSVILMAILVSSCTSKSIDNTAASTPVVSPDSLIGVWNSAWNTTDSITLVNMFNEQSQVVFSTNERFIGSDSIMTKWIRKNLPLVRNLKTNKFIGNYSNDIVYYSGDYSLDIVRNDSIIGSDVGCFTTIWKKQEDKDWKIELMFFGDKK